jgi:hypothetical protein
MKVNGVMRMQRKSKYHEKVPAQILVWTMVNTDDITDLSDECIISMAEIQKDWRVSRP